MPPKKGGPDDPAEWLRRARSNLARARQVPPPPDVLYEDLCFDAQQAAEKAIKALLVRHRVPFPKTHDIALLLSLLAKCGIGVAPELIQSDRLTQYATGARYPGVENDATAGDHQEALMYAERVVAWVEKLLTPPPAGPA